MLFTLAPMQGTKYILVKGRDGDISILVVVESYLIEKSVVEKSQIFRGQRIWEKAQIANWSALYTSYQNTNALGEETPAYPSLVILP